MLSKFLEKLCQFGRKGRSTRKKEEEKRIKHSYIKKGKERTLKYKINKMNLILLVIVKREREENLDSHSFSIYLQLRKYISTIHVTYIKKKGKIVHYKFIIFNTPPQAGAYMSYAPSLLQMYLILGPLRDLVKMSAS